MKYKILGTLNFIIGLLYFFLGFGLNFFVYPQLSEIYNQFEVSSNQLATFQSGRIAYLIIYTAICVTNFYFGFRIFQKNNPSREKDFTYGVIVLIGGFLLGGIAVGITTYSIILPMYSLTDSF